MIKVVTPPMPGTVSESMGPHAERILTCGFARAKVILQPKSLFDPSMRSDAFVSYDKVVLERRVAQASAPYVGDLRWTNPKYVWSYYMDHTGEHYVAEQAELMRYPRAGFPFDILGDHV